MPRQPGLRITKVVWSAPGASASFVIQDPNDNTILLEGATSAAFVGPDPEWDFVDRMAQWRDFAVTTLSAGTLLVYYRA